MTHLLAGRRMDFSSARQSQPLSMTLGSYSALARVLETPKIEGKKCLVFREMPEPEAPRGRSHCEQQQKKILVHPSPAWWAHPQDFLGGRTSLVRRMLPRGPASAPVTWDTLHSE